MEPMPYDILEAMVQSFGKCFHFKDGMAAFLATATVPQSLIDKDRSEPKYVWARRALTELGQTEQGCLIQRKVLTALCNLRNVPDAEVPDKSAGLDALRALKQLAVEKQLVIQKKKEREEDRDNRSQEQARVLKARKEKLESLRGIFNTAIITPDRQAAGYTLEDLLAELFALFEIEFRKSYRTTTQQIDGHFNFAGFDYLVEAKWRKDRPTEQEIGGFKQKVDSKLESTRGLFVSVQGFRSEVITQFSGHGANIILMDGSHLVQILEGRIHLRDGLQEMISKAAQEGIAYTQFAGV
jgi:hypothetical protein